MKQKQKGNGTARAKWFALVFPGALFYYEIALRLLTAGGVLRADALLLALQCCAYGGIGYLLCTLIRSRRANHWLAAALLLAAAVPYGVEAFLYREFKIFYSFQGIFAGTGDVVGDFGSEIVRLVFSGRGLLCIGIYLLPAVLFAILDAGPARIGGRARGMAVARMAAFFLLSWAAIQLIPSLSLLYGDEYNFQSAVERFGLLTGARLETQRDLLGDGGGGFQQVDMTRAFGTAAGAETLSEDAAAEKVSATMEPAPSPAPEDEAAAEPSPTPEGKIRPLDNGYNQLDLPLDDTEAKGWSKKVLDINEYVATLTPSKKNDYTGLFKGKNLIMITAEAFTRQVIDPELTPTLYRLYTKGVHFNDYYQFAGVGTTGGEYQHLFGLVPSNGIDSMVDMTKHKVLLDMPQALAAKGYYGKAFHNNDYTFYDRDKTHTNLGFSDGYMGYGNGMEAYVTYQWPESDYEMFTGTVPTYIDQQPFNIYYMTVSGHGPYLLGSDKMAKKHWDRVADLPYSTPVKAYIAANLDLEDALTYLLEQLEAKGIADDTVICMTADHFPYGLDDGGGIGHLPYLSELYGENVDDVFKRDSSCWILWCGSLEDQEPIVVDSPTCSLDILPTMLNLFGEDFDSRLLPGRDVFSDAPALVFNTIYNWKTDYGAFSDSSYGGFKPSVDESLIPEGYVDTIKTVVRNKLNYCNAVLDIAYFTYLFGE